MCPCDPTAGYVCRHHRGGPEGSGGENAYQHDIRVEYARRAADALRAIRDHFNHQSNVMSQDAVVAATALAVSSAAAPHWRRVRS